MAFVLVVATVLGPSGPRALGPLVLAFVPPASAGAWAFGPAEAWALRGPVLFVALWGFWAGRLPARGGGFGAFVALGNGNNLK